MTTDTKLINVVAEAPTQPPVPAEHHAHVVAEGLPKARPAPRRAARVGRFLLHFLEMQVPMGLGMLLFAVAIPYVRAVPSLAVPFARGSDLSILTDGVLMSVPMVAWMVYRQHGWRHSLEMAAAMIAPMVGIIVLGWLGAYTRFPDLWKAACPIGCTGMTVYMLFRFDHFAGGPAHLAHSAQPGAAACHAK